MRVCGLCWRADKLLLINHSGLQEGPFWAPPGGGMEFGQSAEQNLTREFREETGLVVRVGRLMFVTEYLQPPLHALELFFEVEVIGGDLITGSDPEAAKEDQVIHSVQYLTVSEIDALASAEKHGAFHRVTSAGQIRELNGYFRI
jgi:8-oxo-dGTP diphosphatase